MKKTAVLFATGYEEVEALTVVDLLRRAKIGCDMISVEDQECVTSSHGVSIFMDAKFSETDFSRYDGVILPGGIPGTPNLAADERVLALLRSFADAGKLTAAICAAPTVLAKAGLLEGKKAGCYPGMDQQLTGAKVCFDPVSVDGTVITGRGLGAAIPFGLSIVQYFEGKELADALAAAIVYKQ